MPTPNPWLGNIWTRPVWSLIGKMVLWNNCLILLLWNSLTRGFDLCQDQNLSSSHRLWWQNHIRVISYKSTFSAQKSCKLLKHDPLSFWKKPHFSVKQVRHNDGGWQWDEMSQSFSDEEEREMGLGINQLIHSFHILSQEAFMYGHRHQL